MKKIREFLSERFNNKLIYIFINVMIIGLVLNYVVFPGLTARNSLLNILSAIVGGAILIYVSTFLTKSVRDKLEEVENIVENKKETNEEDKVL
jgi:uncharacterized protein YacL